MKRAMVLFLVFCVVVLGLLFRSKPAGQPDRTGSWGHINQTIKRGADWKQIVTDSAFQLGKEKRHGGTWQQPGGPVDYYYIDMGTYPRMDGSTVCVPLGMEFARQHLGLSDEDARSFVRFSTTHIAYRKLITRDKSGILRAAERTFAEEGPVDIIFVTEPSDDELALARGHRVELVVEPICYDSFVMITHKDNPVDSLTVEQIQKIYSGEITNWKEVGGEDIKIKAFQREQNSGSQTTMEKQVMQGKTMIEPTIVNVVAGMGELVKAVGEYENSRASIGYTFKYYIDTLYKNDNIKVLKINGVEPSNENMRNKTYPFTTNYFAVIRKGEEDSPGGRFLQWLLTDEGQRCIKQAGYCPLRE